MTTIVPPMCCYCRHYHRHPGRTRLTCRAYPQRIPGAIIESRADHRQPYPGDGGLRFAPVDADAGAYAAQLFPQPRHN